MNKFAAAGLLLEASEGRVVVVVSAPGYGQRAFREFDQVIDRAGDVVTRIVKTNGRQRIECDSGGRVLFLTEEGCRGYVADVVYVDDEVSHIADVQRLVPMVTTRPGGEVVRA